MKAIVAPSHPPSAHTDIMMPIRKRIPPAILPFLQPCAFNFFLFLLTFSCIMIYWGIMDIETKKNFHINESSLLMMNAEDGT